MKKLLILFVVMILMWGCTSPPPKEKVIFEKGKFKVTKRTHRDGLGGKDVCYLVSTSNHRSDIITRARDIKIIFDDYLLIDSWEKIVFNNNAEIIFKTRGSLKFLSNNLFCVKKGEIYEIFDKNFDRIIDKRSEIPTNLDACVKNFSQYSELSVWNQNLIAVKPAYRDKYFFISTKNGQHVNSNMYIGIFHYGRDCLGLKEVKSYFSKLTTIKGKYNASKIGAGLLGLIPLVGGGMSGGMINLQVVEELNHRYWLGFEINSHTGQETGRMTIIHKETGEMLSPFSNDKV